MEKTYAICNIEDLELIDFSQVSQTTDTTVRQSLNNQEFVLSYQAEPTFGTGYVEILIHGVETL